jgi:hypothetical protein
MRAHSSGADAMTTPSSGPSGFENPQANLGGADAVDKTSYVTGRGPDPDATVPRSEPRATPRAVKSGGMSGAGWALVAIALLLAVFFGFALFR